MASDKSKILKSAEKYVATGKTALAIDEYLKVLKDNPKEWPIMIQVGDLYLKLNKTSEAIGYFQKVADHYYSDGFFLKAIAIFKRINKLDPSLTEICIKLADLYLKQGLTMDAKSQLQIVAQSYLNKNQHKEAIATLKKLIEIEPDNLKTRNDLAKAYKGEGMVPEAIKEYLEIGDELTRKGLLKESLAVLETANKLDPKDAEVLQQILSIYLQQGEKTKADALLQEAMNADPSNPDLLGLIAQSHAESKDFEKAHETIDRAILASGRKEKLWAMKGDFYLKTGELPKAFTQFSMVVEKQVQRKELEQAVATLQKVAQADPAFYPAWLRLADLYTMLRQQANVVVAYNSLVDAYIGKGLYQEARKYAKKLTELEPEDSQHQQKLQFINSYIDEQARTEVKAEVEPEEEDVDIQVDEPAEAASAAGSAGARKSRQMPPMDQAILRTPIAPIHTEKGAADKSAAGTSQEEKDFISEHLIEAEVFNKYGLIDKAIEQVQLVVGRYPHAVQARQKLKEIYLEKGERNKAVEECIAMSRIFRKQGDEDQAEDILSEARQINPNHPALDKVSRETVSTVKGTEGTDVLGEIEKLAHTIKNKSGPTKMPGGGKKPQSTTDAILSQLFPGQRRSGFSQADKPARSQAKSESAAPKASIPVPETQEEIDLQIIEPPPPARAGELSEEIFEEIDFYIQQGLKAEAKKLLEELQQKHPNDAGIETRLSELSVESPAPAVKKEELMPIDENEIVINLDEFEIPAIEEDVPAQESSTSHQATEVDAEGSQALQVEAAASVPEESWDLSDLHGVTESIQNSGPQNGSEVEIDLDDLEMEVENRGSAESEKVPGEPELNAIAVPESEELTEAETPRPQIESPEATQFMEAAQVLEEQPANSTVQSGDADEARVYSEAMDAVFAKKPGDEQEEVSVSVKAPEELFEEDDGFFDLAAELEEGFLNVQSAVEEDRPPDGQNYSLEEILSDFRKGVDKQLGSEDYDTRYNLGIAYKEMGLIDEAIAEFQVAAKDPKRFLECCSMLGLCFMEKGMPKLAIKWYQRGLDTPGYSEDEYHGVRFELAQAYETIDELKSALEIYQEVYGINAGYRNVMKKIKDVQERLKNK